MKVVGRRGEELMMWADSRGKAKGEEVVRAIVKWVIIVEFN